MKPMLIAAIGLAVLIGSLVPVVGPDLKAQDKDISPEQVRNAIDRGVAYLKQSQADNGTWTDMLGQPGGVTALCTLALLNAGVDPQDEQIQRSLKYLRKLRPHTTYVASLQTMVLCRAEPEKDQVLIGRNVEWIESNQIREGPRTGAWSYPIGNGDNSNSQFALLALYEADRCAEAGLIHVNVHRDTWERARAYWTGCQNDNGSWGYYRPLEGSGSMTCAGISSLIISSDLIHQADARVTGDHIDCCARSETDNSDKIENALAWLARNFSIERNPGQRAAGLWHLYYLYGLERVGRLTAHRFIGGSDWYREASALLVKQQDGLSGYWRGMGHAEDDRNIGTSLALLFLSKGRRPVLLAKLKYGRNEDWNQRRADVNNLTLFVESRWKREMTWQVIDLEAASVDDLLQAPVLYFSGNRNPMPPTEERQRQLAQKLRDYLDRGGFIFAEGDCCSTGFDAGFRRLMEMVFPEREYRLKPLDPSHPVWHAEEKVAPDERLLLGIDFGCRTSVIYAPPDPPAEPRPSLSCLWELSRLGRRQKLANSVQAQIDVACAIGINVLAYATNREVKYKYDIPATMTEGKPGDRIDRGRLYIAKLRHPGGCDAAPRALANLMESASRELKVRVDLHPKLISIQDSNLFTFPVVFMHGRNAFRLTDEERARLRTYVDRGGVIFADAICGSRAFVESFRREMEAIFPKNPLERIPSTDPMWTKQYGGFNLSTVRRRDPQPGSEGGPLKAAIRTVPPELEGIQFGDRYAVIFSQFDLSCALEKQDSLECRGYVREDAAKIGLNVLLYAVQQ